MKNKKEMDFNGRSVTCHSPAFIKLKLFHLQLIVFTLLLVKSRIPALISVSVSASLSLSLSLAQNTHAKSTLTGKISVYLYFGTFLFILGYNLSIYLSMLSIRFVDFLFCCVLS